MPSTLTAAPRSFSPDFNQMLKVLRRQKPDRPVQYELFLNMKLYSEYGNEGRPMPTNQPEEMVVCIAHAFAALGYDHCHPWGLYDFCFPKNTQARAETISLNEGSVIQTREDFERYPWPDVAKARFVDFDKIAKRIPSGMKLMPLGPGGVLENTISLVGYENLCLMLNDDPDLARDIFDAVGSRLLQMYEILLPQEVVGAIVSNDDWGFKTQTMLSTQQMRQYVFPWHKKIVAAAHRIGKPVVLHSCGNPETIIEDIIQDLKFDGKHSYEDTIIPVETAYEQWQGRIAVMGGLDVDFLCRKTPEEVYRRTCAMLERTAGRGGWALGSGNSIPEYIPRPAYLAMLRAGWEKM